MSLSRGVSPLVGTTPLMLGGLYVSAGSKNGLVVVVVLDAAVGLFLNLCGLSRLIQFFEVIDGDYGFEKGRNVS